MARFLTVRDGSSELLDRLMTYAEKLKDPRWQERRLKILEAAGWKCSEPCCEFRNENPTLHVHHKVYIRGLDPWEYEDWALQVLCEKCHKINQEIMQSAHVFLAKNPGFFLILSELSKLPPPEVSNIEDGISALVFFTPEIRVSLSKLFNTFCMSSSELIASAYSAGNKSGKDSTK